MKAIRYTRYGPPEVLQLTDVDMPPLEDNRVLVNVLAASINALDGHAVRKGPLLIRLISGNGVRKPKDPRLGMDLAGRVEAVGAKVTQFRVGDEVFGRGPGAFAEYSCPLETSLALKPANLTFAQAAAIPVAALTALEGVRDAGHIHPGQRVAIQGAAGGVGSYAVQFAKLFGAEVTAVCSPQSAEQARALGADHVIDYTQVDFTRVGQRYDLIVAVNGYHPLRAYRRALTPTGRYVMVGAATDQLLSTLAQTMLLGPVFSRAKGQHIGFMGVAKTTQKDLVYIKELLEAGKIAPVIDRQYPMHEMVAAMRYFETGHVRGKVVITMDQGNV
jgi:NADPH:quinone reductase-like Zn-dependent oxidoreductase